MDNMLAEGQFPLHIGEKSTKCYDKWFEAPNSAAGTATPHLPHISISEPIASTPPPPPPPPVGIQTPPHVHQLIHFHYRRIRSAVASQKPNDDALWTMNSHCPISITIAYRKQEYYVYMQKWIFASFVFLFFFFFSCPFSRRWMMARACTFSDFRNQKRLRRLLWFTLLGLWPIARWPVRPQEVIYVSGDASELVCWGSDAPNHTSNQSHGHRDGGLTKQPWGLGDRLCVWCHAYRTIHEKRCEYSNAQWMGQMPNQRS